MNNKNEIHAIELRVHRKSDKAPLIVSFAGLFDDYKRLLSFYKEDEHASQIEVTNLANFDYVTYTRESYGWKRNDNNL
jgi:hypothetical protein